MCSAQISCRHELTFVVSPLTPYLSSLLWAYPYIFCFLFLDFFFLLSFLFSSFSSPSFHFFSIHSLKTQTNPHSVSVAMLFNIVIYLPYGATPSALALARRLREAIKANRMEAWMMMMGMGTRTRMLGLLSLRFLRWGHADSGHGAHTDRSDGHIFKLGNV